MENTQSEAFDLGQLLNDKLAEKEARGEVETKGAGRPRKSSTSSASAGGSVYEGPRVDPSKVAAARPIVETVLNALYGSFDAKPLTESEADMMSKSTVALIDHYMTGPIHPAFWFVGGLGVCTLARRNEIAAAIEARQLGTDSTPKQGAEDVQIRKEF